MVQVVRIKPQYYVCFETFCAVQHMFLEGRNEEEELAQNHDKLHSLLPLFPILG